MNVADRHPDIVRRMTALAVKARIELGDCDQSGAGQRLPGWLDGRMPMPIAK